MSLLRLTNCVSKAVISLATSDHPTAATDDAKRQEAAMRVEESFMV